MNPDFVRLVHAERQKRFEREVEIHRLIRIRRAARRSTR
jgi:hypothetical protein